LGGGSWEYGGRWGGAPAGAGGAGGGSDWEKAKRGRRVRVRVRKDLIVLELWENEKKEGWFVIVTGLWRSSMTPLQTTYICTLYIPVND
jgi:hypothetical protein